MAKTVEVTFEVKVNVTIAVHDTDRIDGKPNYKKVLGDATKSAIENAVHSRWARNHFYRPQRVNVFLGPVIARSMKLEEAKWEQLDWNDWSFCAKMKTGHRYSVASCWRNKAVRFGDADTYEWEIWFSNNEVVDGEEESLQEAQKAVEKALKTRGFKWNDNRDPA